MGTKSLELSSSNCFFERSGSFLLAIVKKSLVESKVNCPKSLLRSYWIYENLCEPSTFVKISWRYNT